MKYLVTLPTFKIKSSNVAVLSEGLLTGGAKNSCDCERTDEKRPWHKKPIFTNKLELLLERIRRSRIINDQREYFFFKSRRRQDYKT